MENLASLGFYLNPIAAVVFCINLVSIIKKTKNDKGTEFKSTEPDTTWNTTWMSISLAYIVFSMTYLILEA